ncbi:MULTISPECIES: HXXEE domain-containing protein [unclassified Chelatococcus]|uniref:HXXEE domain-containing protein n=1 Tax=unclassified Chelatococcus TaxID=2638111 RepID=UPI001BCF8BFC|nr:MULTISPECIES: HXXEE domain-containing protein [unclassified Chelatococcus]MBS7700451.1 HXXEE domain-containing protein [Chelatococcus sp. YT9]MBX3556247.1 HXXEE domain-containing protein [Chelatococcus sp.]
MQNLKVWLASRWVVAAGFMAAALLAIAPLLHAAYALPLVLIFLHSPGYMLHQVEEHTGDRFRTFVNQRVFAGHNALSVAAVLVINLPVVWGLNLAALYAAYLWGAGFGLVAPYTMLLNGVTHIGGAARFRSYNPGLVTSLVVFLPLSLWTIIAIGPVEASFHLTALGLAVILHLLIVADVLLRIRRNAG